MSTPSQSLSRRKFLQRAAAATAFTIVPRHVLGGPGRKAPNDKLNIAGVGLVGMGKVNLQNVESENIVALCDVDHGACADIFKKYPDAKVYADYRKMLEQTDIDAVIIATPDHTHSIISIAAMELGKHVYTQKPLTRLVSEARLLTEAEERYNVVTQMGTQHHSSEGFRRTVEFVRDGAIGAVTEVHVWTNRPIWPQAIPTPTDRPPVPEGLDWDLWLGPAPKRPYHPIYHPFSWRGWWDFGSGALGDIGCHSIDWPYTALKLTNPTTVEASIAEPGEGEDPMDVFPRASLVHYRYPEREGMPPVVLSWYDGGLIPRKPEWIPPEEELGSGGTMFIGEKGCMLTTDEDPKVYPLSLRESYTPPPKTIPRVEMSHEMDWVEACKEGDKRRPGSNFSYAGPLTETVVLGNLAVRYPNATLSWDPETMEVTNHAEASEYIAMDYRKDW